jgi:Crp-like helix-turn-helix domain
MSEVRFYQNTQDQTQLIIPLARQSGCPRPLTGRGFFRAGFLANVRLAYPGEERPDRRRLSRSAVQLNRKRLARLLLLLANFGKEGRAEPILAKISQETLAEMIDTTRPRVSHFMNKFRQLGFIDYNGHLEVHNFLCNETAQRRFDRGMRYQHSFW